jgi:hypothetical protein
VTFFSARFVDNWVDIVLSLKGYLFDRRLRSTTKLEKLWAMFFFLLLKILTPGQAMTKDNVRKACTLL